MSAVSGSTSTNPSIWAPVTPDNSGQDADLADAATSMSIDAAVVGSLEGSSVVSLSASSLLNQLVHANQQSQRMLAPSGTPTPATDGTSANGASAGSDSTPTYDASGALQDLGNANANWAKVLESNPELAPDAVQAMIGQGIINTLV